MNISQVIIIIYAIITLVNPFNLETQQGTQKFIQSPLLQKNGTRLSNQFKTFPNGFSPTYFGFDFTFDNGGLMIGAPKTVGSTSRMKKLKDAGQLFVCKLNQLFNESWKSSDMCEAKLFENKERTNFGLDVVKPNNNQIKICTTTQPKDCGETWHLPGICYNSRNDRNNWKLDNAETFECPKRPLDVIFLLDGSGSVGSWNFQKVKDWTTSLTSKLVKQNKETQVGVNQYSSEESFKTEIKLAEITNQDNFDRSVQNIRYHSGGFTHTADALRETVKDFQSSYRYNSPSTNKVLILLTDGVSNDRKYLPQASKHVKSVGITTFAVGVDGANEDELKIITNEDTDRIFYVSDFASLDNIVDKLQEKIALVALEGKGTGNETKDYFYKYEFNQEGISSTTLKVFFN